MNKKKRSNNRLTLSTHFVKSHGEPVEWVSQADAARLRGVTRQAIARLVEKGRFRVLQVGGRLFLDRKDVEQYKPEAPGRPKNGRKLRGSKKTH